MSSAPSLIPLYSVLNLLMYDFKKIILFIYVCILGCAGSLLLHTGFLWLWQARVTLRSGV